MSHPLDDSDSDGRRRGDDWTDMRKILDSLRFRIERLIDQELSATPSNGGKTARESSTRSTDPGPELFDQVTGRRIFG